LDRKRNLKNLAYDASYARKQKHEELINPLKARLQAKGSTQTLEEMIASTKRGVWYIVFTGISEMDNHSALLSGLSRDGTF